MARRTPAGFQVLSLRDPCLKVQTYKKRREHHRTKSGCLKCRAKRVRCDEQKPICIRCHRNNRSCVYEYSCHFPNSASSSASNRRNAGSISLLSADTLDPFFASTTPNGITSNQLLLHFHGHLDDIFQVHRVEDMISMSKTNPLVRNTILATTASHLRHLSPSIKEYQVSAHYHQSLAVQNLREALDTPRDFLGQDGAKALLISVILLNMISFCIPEHESEDPEMSWIFSTKEDRVGWLALQTGLRPILQSLTTYIEDVVEFLGPIFIGGDNSSWNFRNMQQDLAGIPQSWIDIFQLRESNMGVDCEPASTGYNDLYRLAIIQLSDIRKVEHIRSNTFRYLQFLNKIPPSFRNLLYHRDQRALWLFGYWLGLMCRFEDVWWFRKRVMRDYTAIVLWLKRLHLERLPGAEGDNWREMILDLELAPIYRLTHI